MVSRTGRLRLWQVVAAIAGAAVVGFTVFGVLAWRSIAVERAEPEHALRKFEDARRQFIGMEPILRAAANGTIVRQPVPPDPLPAPTRLCVLAYRVAERRLIRADVPFWFLKVKGPAMRYAFQETGFDLERLGITPPELERYGAVLVFDEAGQNGDRLLVWTQ